MSNSGGLSIGSGYYGFSALASHFVLCFCITVPELDDVILQGLLQQPVSVSSEAESTRIYFFAIGLVSIYRQEDTTKRRFSNRPAPTLTRNQHVHLFF